MVYPAVFSRPDLNGFALVLFNWTAQGDTFTETNPAGAVGGEQSITYTIDPASFGMPTGSYTVRELTLNGLGSPSDTTLPQTVTKSVNATSLRFFVYTKV